MAGMESLQKFSGMRKHLTYKEIPSAGSTDQSVFKMHVLDTADRSVESICVLIKILEEITILINSNIFNRLYKW